MTALTETYGYYREITSLLQDVIDSKKAESRLGPQDLEKYFSTLIETIRNIVTSPPQPEVRQEKLADLFGMTAEELDKLIKKAYSIIPPETDLTEVRLSSVDQEKTKGKFPGLPILSLLFFASTFSFFCDNTASISYMYKSIAKASGLEITSSTLDKDDYAEILKNDLIKFVRTQLQTRGAGAGAALTETPGTLFDPSHDEEETIATHIARLKESFQAIDESKLSPDDSRTLLARYKEAETPTTTQRPE